MNTDKVADMFARIKNAQQLHNKEVKINQNKIYLPILNILLKEGYIRGFKINNSFTITIFLKYFNEKPVISNLTKVSKPGRRIYISTKTLWKKSQSLGVIILSTSKGIISNNDAKKLNIGGEVICYVF
jgi:small subunit ribosomal protein S8